MNNQFISNTSTHIRYTELKVILNNLFSSLDETLLEELMGKFTWKELASGQRLFAEGEAGKSLCILIAGRLKAVIHTGTENEKLVGEISKGESVGEMALLTGENRTASVFATRDSVLAELSKQHFEELVSQHPGLMMNISRIIISRLTHTMHQTKAPAKNFTIALVPATPNVPIGKLCRQLSQAMAAYKDVLHLNHDSIPSDFKHNGTIDNQDTFGLNHWLATREMQHDYILYETDFTNTAWTQKCLRQADKVVVVVNAQEEIALSDLETKVFLNEESQYKQAKELVLLYPSTTEFPTFSHKMLAKRPVKRHYNIRLDDPEHMRRLARMVTDSGIGLILSGGGARGFAHIGIFKALKEMGLSVDMVCGTSMGGIIAAGIAIDYKLDYLLGQYRSAFVDDKPLNDYTLPVISLIKGHKLQKINQKYFKDFHIEDLWLNFFCVSCNYSTSEIVIHDKGPLWKAVTASASIPGVLPPVVEGNHLLVDGGVVNNFPVDIMKSKYGGKLIGIDLKVEKEYKLNYTSLPGGWYLFFSKFVPFMKRYKSPSLATIMMKSTLLASARHQREMIPDLDLYLRPPVGGFGLLKLNEFDKIVQAGYTYATGALSKDDLKAFYVPAS